MPDAGEQAGGSVEHERTDGNDGDTGAMQPALAEAGAQAAGEVHAEG